MQSEKQYSPSKGPEGGPGSGKPVIIELIPKNKAFDKKSITVPAGASVTINFHNKDFLTPHNFALYTDSSAQNVIFKGKILLVEKEISYKFTAPSEPGTYFF